jgi:hypothetical protein
MFHKKENPTPGGRGLSMFFFGERAGREDFADLMSSQPKRGNKSS